MGSSFLIIASKNRIHDLSERVKAGFGNGYKLIFSVFGGECSRKEIERQTAIAVKEKCDGVIGIGGGKVIDTVKMVGNQVNAPVVVVPTIAASDASTSALAVVYNDDGSLEKEVHFNNNPEIVLVDTEIIMNAPVRFLVAGMGDALSTWFGALVVYQQYKNNEFGAKPTEASMAISRLSFDILTRHGLAAKIACENKVITKDLNKIIECNVLLSGLGMESSGGASDHSFYYGFCALTNRKETKLHGEYVPFSTICMLILEGASKEELDEIYKFCMSVSLPICLEDLDLGDLTEEEYVTIARSVMEQEGPKNHPFEIEEADVIGALKTADVMGQMYKSGSSLLS